MIKDLYNWMIQWSGTPAAPYALFLIAFAESSFFPLPPDLLLIPMCLAEPDQAFWYAALCTLGSVLGGGFGLGIGKYGGRPVLQKLIHEDRIAWAEQLYQKYDAWAIGIAGFTPIPYKVFTILAGILRIKLRKLILVSIFSRGARFFLIATLLHYKGELMREFIDKYFNLLSILFVLALLGGFAAVKFLGRKKTATFEEASR
ncbi:MAG: DedA family protein [Deltaproteobacteria bacterium]|nr:DedA family protein [Deltaproteobacteria bacterium]